MPVPYGAQVLTKGVQFTIFKRHPERRIAEKQIAVGMTDHIVGPIEFLAIRVFHKNLKRTAGGIPAGYPPLQTFTLHDTALQIKAGAVAIACLADELRRDDLEVDAVHADLADEGSIAALVGRAASAAAASARSEATLLRAYQVRGSMGADSKTGTWRW